MLQADLAISGQISRHFAEENWAAALAGAVRWLAYLQFLQARCEMYTRPLARSLLRRTKLLSLFLM